MTQNFTGNWKQDPIKTILETEKEQTKKIELLKEEIESELENSSKNLEEWLIIVKKNAENESAADKENLKNKAKKAYMVEFEKYTKEASKISSIDVENQSKDISSDFFNKIAV